MSEYNKTHVASGFLLPLWGGGTMDTRGEVAILVGSAIVVFVGLVDILVEKIYAVSFPHFPTYLSFLSLSFNLKLLKLIYITTQLRSLPSLHTFFSLLAPIAGLITSIVATALQYHVNTSSTSSTLLSWSCQWQTVSMSSSPNFNVICKEARVALYLTVVLIPLEVMVLGLAGARVVVGKKVGGMGAFDRKG